MVEQGKESITQLIPGEKESPWKAELQRLEDQLPLVPQEAYLEHYPVVQQALRDIVQTTDRSRKWSDHPGYRPRNFALNERNSAEVAEMFLETFDFLKSAKELGLDENQVTNRAKHALYYARRSDNVHEGDQRSFLGRMAKRVVGDIRAGLPNQDITLLFGDDEKGTSLKKTYAKAQGEDNDQAALAYILNNLIVMHAKVPDFENKVAETINTEYLTANIQEDLNIIDPSAFERYVTEAVANIAPVEEGAFTSKRRQELRDNGNTIVFKQITDKTGASVSYIHMEDRFGNATTIRTASNAQGGDKNRQHNPLRMDVSKVGVGSIFTFDQGQETPSPSYNFLDLPNEGMHAALTQAVRDLKDLRKNGFQLV